MNPDDGITVLPGVGGQRARALSAMGIHAVKDLLFYFPRDYDDRSDVKAVAMLMPGATGTIRGRVSEIENINFAQKKTGKPLIMTKAKLRDETGELELIWFNQPYLKGYFRKDLSYVFTGKVKLSFKGKQMEAPDYSPEPQAVAGGAPSVGIIPVYGTVKSVSQKMFRSIVFSALKYCGDFFCADDLPRAVIKKYNLCDINTAVRQIHFPESDAMFHAARRRLVFEELFFMQAALFKVKGAASGEPGRVMDDADISPFAEMLPFKLTAAQSKVLREIAADLRSGRRMNRLIQGDVGSGKTAVAMAAAYAVIKNGCQAAIMAPTEVLAGQHYEEFNKYFSRLGIKTVLLTGGLTLKERRAALAAVKDGSAGMITGTHSLIQGGVEYASLGLVITDEQHRFGVNQRLELFMKGHLPHTLVMTATPIPRTLGLILYGDMDVSVIGELPPGRIQIKTYCVGGAYRERIRGFIGREVAAGRQAYVICPAIEEAEEAASNLKREHGSEENSNLKREIDYEAVNDRQRESARDLKNVTRYTRELSRALPGVRIAALHGRMKPAEKVETMRAFKAGETDVIVSTTVIEVGVHVDNATLMIIENAERFGLSQLHQLRGRVGRGSLSSYCVLVTDVKNEETKKRMDAMTSTTDGFKLSELDLELRGAGDFFGTRQHGLPAFTIANLYRDTDTLREAQAAAVDVFRHSLDIPEAERERIHARAAKVLKAAGGAGTL